MAQSLLKALKQFDPNCLIDVLAPAWSRPILDRVPELHQAIALPIGHGVLALKLRHQLAKTLASNHYTQAIVLPNSWKSALIPWLAKIPKRTGWRGEWRFGLLNDLRRLDKAEFPRMIDQFVALAYPKGYQKSSMMIPFPQLRVQSDAIPHLREKFSIPSETGPILTLCPGAEFGPSKRWPTSHYATIAQEKLQKGWSVFLLGSKKDAAVVEEIQTQTQHACIDLTATSLGEAIDLLSLTTAVVTNDSGMMHIAAALNKPLIALYGSTDPSFTPPLHPQAQSLRLGLPCSPCFKRDCPLGHHRCMEELSPNQVLTALEAIEG